MTTPLSRMRFTHPTQGQAGDATLYSQIEVIYQAIGDAMPFRWFTSASLANGATVTLTHNFLLAFAEMQFRFYTYTGTFGPTTALTRQAQGASGVSVIANVTNPTTQVDITNNTGGTISVATLISEIRYAEKLSDLSDADTTGAQDGQALVYDVASGKFKPGASGDASLKLQSVSGTNLTLKGGQLYSSDGQIFATYSGSGSVKASFRVDLTLALNTILGGSPANATYYQLAIDRQVAQTETTTTDSKEKLTQTVQANFVLLTSYPEATDRGRYIPIGWLRSADTGTAWTGTGSDFGTYPTRFADPEERLPYNFYVHPSIIAPNVYATLTAAFAAASAGDRILVLGGYTITSAETLSLSNIEVKFLPNIKITINAAVKGLIVSGSDNLILDAKYISAFSGTIPSGIEVSGDNNNVDRAKVESNAAGTTITAAFNLTGNANMVTGLAKQSAGSIVDNITDSGTGNDYRVR